MLFRSVAGYPVTAECALSGGLPNFELVGLPDAAVKEARERVRSAVKSSGFDFPVSRITVNLAPAGRRKAGTVYDLPILVGILCAGGLLSLNSERESAYVEFHAHFHLIPRNDILEYLHFTAHQRRLCGIIQRKPTSPIKNNLIAHDFECRTCA